MIIKFKDFLLENVEFKHTNPAKNQAVLFIGRFQPLTIGHVDLYNKSKAKIKNRKVIFVIIRGKKTPKEKSPFPLELSKKIIKSCIPNSEVYEFNTGFIPDIIDELRGKDYEVELVFCGPDRYEGYKKQIERYGDLLNSHPQIIVFPRDKKKVSGTKVREALKNDDKDTFEKLTPKCEHKYYEELRKYI